MPKLFLLILIAVCAPLRAWAQTSAAADIEQLQKQMYQLYNKNDETAFLDVTNQLKDAAHKAGDEPTSPTAICISATRATTLPYSTASSYPWSPTPPLACGPSLISWARR